MQLRQKLIGHLLMHLCGWVAIAAKSIAGILRRFEQGNVRYCHALAGGHHLFQGRFQLRSRAACLGGVDHKVNIDTGIVGLNLLDESDVGGHKGRHIQCTTVAVEIVVAQVDEDHIRLPFGEIPLAVWAR